MAHRVQEFQLTEVWFPQFHYKRFKISIESGAIRLPRLKKLDICDISYDNDGTLPNMVSGCSAIEDLVLRRRITRCDEMVCCYVCSPTLKSLEMEVELECDDDHKHNLVLDLPVVQNLQIQDNVSQIIQAKNPSSLVQANICFFKGYVVADIRRSRYIFQFIEKLSNAKSLTISGEDSTLLLNSTFSFATRRFHNLINLDLQANWHVLTKLLACAYKLESLTILEVYDELKCWRQPKQLPECLLSSLQCVTIYGFVGRKHEFNMVRYILRHAKVLKTMNIYSVYPDCPKFDILKRILYFPRGSARRCRVTFV
ncbi:F-box/FBD/LRR-repeat protein At4g26340-like [Henckelia pumila]|uniref:F-box/FBD/LRR-repeat protein At4g26340-like n=1 Tax=Henckelia pumila TaxID=405737 RepID=UPI003C6DDCA5